MATKMTIWKSWLAVLCTTLLTVISLVGVGATTNIVKVYRTTEGTAQQLTVRGKVTDALGSPLADATIRAKDGSAQSRTDENGEFAITVRNNNVVLVVNYVGYETVELPVSTSFMTITLTSQETSLDEVIVVGYGTQKKINLTGAVTQISGEVLQSRPVANVGQALQGTVPNLNVSTITTTSADPGGPWAPAGFNVRGTTSINGGEPLFVVDGIPASNINNINPNDIESISVLKDAAAGAIYGARASYGVILITTKSGGKDSRTEVNFSSISGWSGYTALPRPVNSVDYALAYNRGAVNAGAPEPFSEAFIARLRQYIADPTSIPVTQPDPTMFNEWNWTEANDNVNYFDAYLKPFSFNQKFDVSVNGGSKALSYFVSAAYYDLGGQLRYGDEQFNRYNLTSNIRSEPLDWLRLDLKVRYGREDTDIPYHYADQQGNWFHLAGSRRAYWPYRNPDGQLARISGLIAIANGGRTIKADNDLWLTGNIEVEPVAGWKVNANYSFNDFYTRSMDHYAKVYWYGVDGSTIYNPAPNWLNREFNNSGYTSLNVYTSYEKQWAKHHFGALAGYQQEEREFLTTSGRRMDLITDLLPSIRLATGTQTASDVLTDWATIGSFGRLTYNFDEKYLVEFNARYDGTSRFPRNRRFGFFPSFAVAYNMAKEPFWPLVETVPYFKLRTSYGSLGNQTIGNLGNYLYMTYYTITPNASYTFGNSLMSTLAAPGIVSADLTWETVRTMNLGLDASALRNRLDVTFDWYWRNTLDMLGPSEALPVVLGTAVPRQNNADLQTRGFELTISWRDRIRENFNYHASLMLSDYTAFVKRYNNPTGILTTYYEGMRVGDIWGFVTEGIIQNEAQIANMPDQSLFHGRWIPGDIQYRDLDNNQIINRGDNTIYNPGDQMVIGNNTPRYSLASNMGFDYKGFDLNMFWQGVLKRDLALNGTFFYGFSSAFNAIWENSLDYWTPENPDAYWSNPYSTTEYDKNRQTQTRYLQNGAYLRLKNLQLGYTIPRRWLNRLAIDRCRVFCSGENLLTFTGIQEGMDPETAAFGVYGSGKVYPLMRTYSVGINVGF